MSAPWRGGYRISGSWNFGSGTGHSEFVVGGFMSTQGGELVTDEAIVTLARIDPLRVEVIVPAEHYGRIRGAMQAEIASFLRP